MTKNTNKIKEVVLSHFTARAEKYNDSSHWCTDDILLQKIFSTLAPKGDEYVLDVACGTGLVGQHFKDKVKKIVGVDITEAMFTQAQKNLNHIVRGSAEVLPFKDNSFDICYERQGIQFMNAQKAVSEMVRVTRPGGKICLVQLCAYGEEDKKEYFDILRYRNPARCNFFTREALKELLEKAGCTDIEMIDLISEEDVGRWADNGAINSDEQNKIREVYKNASEGFNKYHAVRIEADGRIIDKMLFSIAFARIT